MKSTPWDYVWTGLWITLLLAAAAAAVHTVSPWTRGLLGAYHVLVDLALLLLSYGLLSALVVRTIVKLKPLAPGAHGLDSAEFARWKLLTVLYRFGQGALRPFIEHLRPRRGQRDQQQDEGGNAGLALAGLQDWEHGRGL